MINCLVIIDVQEGFMKNPETKKVPDNLELLLKKQYFDHIVCTKFINCPGSPYEKLMGWSGLRDIKSQKIAPYVEKISEKIFEKQVYTCFVPEFEEYLLKNKIEKLYFLGVDTDCCVLKSASDCFERNIPFEVLINYCASNGGDKSHNAAIRVMERTIGKNCINYSI